MHDDNPIFAGVNQRVFGTFRGDGLEAAIDRAIEVGYRHFDTAQMYGNEADVGAALATCGVPRDGLCVTTKVHPDHYHADRFLPSVKQSLDDLQLDAVDVLLLHWPPLDGSDITPPLELLLAAKEQGLARDVGVSNFTAAMMRRAREVCGDGTVKGNQVEFHPLLDQRVLLAAVDATGIPLLGYCSLARGLAARNPMLATVGRCNDNKSPSQVALRWAVQHGVAPVTRSADPGHIRDNFAIMDFELDDREMGIIDSLGRTDLRIVTKELMPGAPEWD